MVKWSIKNAYNTIVRRNISFKISVIRVYGKKKSIPNQICPSSETTGIKLANPVFQYLAVSVIYYI